ncbi:hypothetical protein AC249_AIPGENE9129, partial [Exaiptasia diaphana]
VQKSGNTEVKNLSHMLDVGDFADEAGSGEQYASTTDF